MNDTERDAKPLTAGDELAGRYRLERPLGEGGMGVVWEARQITTQKAVAIKILKGNDSADTARFLREARVAAALQHRNIVQVFDFWEVEGTGPVFMVMELLRGETLASLLARMGRLSYQDTMSILVPVAHAIRTAHAEGVVHRDLKPENVFLAKAGGQRDSSAETFEVKVLDFGLAKPMASSPAATALTHTGSVMGTPFYMAPEQVYGEKDIDGRADLWAFGVLLYECLSGGRPFFGENYGQVFRQISSGTYRPLSELVPELPMFVDGIIARLLTHDRERRAANIDEVIDALTSRGAMQPAAPHTRAMPQPTVRIASQSPREGSAITPGHITPGHMTPNQLAPGAVTPGQGGLPAATVIAASTSVRPTPPPTIPLKVIAIFGGLAVLGLLVVTFFVASTMRTPKTITTTAPLESPHIATPTLTPAPTAVATAPSAATATAPSATPTISASALPSASAAPASRSKVPSTPRAGKEPAKDPSRDPLSGGRF